ncbi:MAG: ribonuclease HI family protein [Candidatus Paceibacterota bacterium]
MERQVKKIIVSTDGGARGNPGIAGAGVYITDAHGTVLKEIAEPLGVQTNNFAEYEAIILGLHALKKMFGKEKLKTVEIEVRSDSELIVSQLNGHYQIKEPTLFPKFISIWNMRVALFSRISFVHVRRENNKDADRLANEAMDKASR